jgi:hypothetical protein
LKQFVACVSMRAPYEPEMLAVVDTAVDRVWPEVAAAFDTPRSQQAARRVLADAILARANSERGSIEDFVDAGRRALALKYPWLIEQH